MLTRQSKLLILTCEKLVRKGCSNCMSWKNLDMPLLRIQSSTRRKPRSGMTNTYLKETFKWENGCFCSIPDSISFLEN
jgi:hypothetical protein